jgi:hypothetical protein
MLDAISIVTDVEDLPDSIGSPHRVAAPVITDLKPIGAIISNKYCGEAVAALLSDDYRGEFIASLIIDIDQLHAWHDKPDINSFEFHERFKYSLKRLAEKYRLQGINEFEVDDRGDGKKGFVDVVWIENNVPFVAIEIDRQFRKKSLFKLRRTMAPFKFQIFMAPVDYNPMAFRDIFIIPKIRKKGNFSYSEVHPFTFAPSELWI